MPQLPSPVIGLLTHPPYGEISRELGPTLTFGTTQIQRIRQLGPFQINVDATGLSFAFVTVPDGFGFQYGLINTYDDFICEFAPVYTLFDGHDVYGPRTQVFSEGAIYVLDQLLPTRIDVFVQVGCVVTVFWLLALQRLL